MPEGRPPDPKSAVEHAVRIREDGPVPTDPIEDRLQAVHRAEANGRQPDARVIVMALHLDQVLVARQSVAVAKQDQQLDAAQGPETHGTPVSCREREVADRDGGGFGYRHDVHRGRRGSSGQCRAWPLGARPPVGWQRARRAPTRLVRATRSHTDYLRAFIFEVLRWRAPVVDTVRELEDPLEVGHHRIDPGTLHLVSPHLVRHRPDLYPAPSAFVPDRFVGRLAPDPKSWTPFGGGVRRCLGADLAVLEMEVVLSLLLDRFTVGHTWSSGEAARLAGTVVLPSRGAEITLSRADRPAG